MNGERKEAKVMLDFSAAAGMGEIHDMLKERLAFPEYYGRNWDALYDCLTDFAMDIGGCCVEICGFSAMDDGLKQACAPMLQVFEDIHEEYPDVRFIMVS